MGGSLGVSSLGADGLFSQKRIKVDTTLRQALSQTIRPPVYSSKGLLASLKIISSSLNCLQHPPPSLLSLNSKPPQQVIHFPPGIFLAYMRHTHQETSVCSSLINLSFITEVKTRPPQPPPQHPYTTLIQECSKRHADVYQQQCCL